MAKKATEKYKDAQSQEEESLKELNNSIYESLYEGKDDSTPGTMAGKGTGEDPYLIESIEDLMYLSEQVNAGTTYEGQEIKLMVNLNFKSDNSYTNPIENKPKMTTGAGFTPIGTESVRFQGDFNGNNKEISNLYIENDTNRDLGLFGGIENSSIHDLNVSGNIHTTVTSECSGIVANAYGTCNLNNLKNYVNLINDLGLNTIGGVISENYGTLKIIDCVNGGIIKNSKQAGGLLGWNSGTLLIENSYNIGEIINEKGLSIGGLLGRDNATTSMTTIKNSYNKGNVTSSVESESEICVGGLAGRIYGTLTVENSHNEGNITQTRNNFSDFLYYNVGGLVGLMSKGTETEINKIENSYNKGKIEGGIYAGGLVGRTEGAGALIINLSYNSGELDNSNLTFTDSSRHLYVTIGGIIGYTTINDSNHKSTANNYALNTYNVGAIIGYESVAGIIGFGRNRTCRLYN